MGLFGHRGHGGQREVCRALRTSLIFSRCEASANPCAASAWPFDNGLHKLCSPANLCTYALCNFWLFHGNFIFFILIFAVFVVFCGVKERPQEIVKNYLTG